MATDEIANLKALKKEIRNSARFTRTMEIFEGLKGFDVDTLHDEVLGYQAQRGNREHHALKRTPKKKIIEYASEDAALRSRISYIQVSARRLVFRVSFLVDAFKNWILSEYSNKLKGTSQVKNATIEDIGIEMLSFLDRLNSLDDCCGICLEDIDQGQWQRKAVVSVLELQAKPEGKL